MLEDKLIKKNLETSKTIAMVGVSSIKKEISTNIKRRPSTIVMKYMQEFGYRVIPVNPFSAGEKIHGETIVAKLEDIKIPVDIVDVFRPSKEAPIIAEEAIKIGTKVFWLQYGIQSDEAKKIVDDVYHELFGRFADPNGLQYWGSMIEVGKMTEDDLREAILDSEEYAFNSTLLVVDTVSVQNGVPIVLSWATYNSGFMSPFLVESNSRFGDGQIAERGEDTFNTLVSGYHIYRDNQALERIDDLNEICTEDGFCVYEDHLVEDGNSYFYQITPITSLGEVAQGCLDYRQVCFGIYEGTQHYPGFTGYAETEP